MRVRQALWIVRRDAGFDVTRASKWAYVFLMRGLRQSPQAFVIAALAVVATLFLTTAAMAHDVRPPEQMAMTGTGMPGQPPCDDVGKVDCLPHCAVLCQALLVEPVTVAAAVSPAKARYAWSQVGLEPVDLDTEDPPPRPRFL